MFFVELLRNFVQTLQELILASVNFENEREKRENDLFSDTLPLVYFPLRKKGNICRSSKISSQNKQERVKNGNLKLSYLLEEFLNILWLKSRLQIPDPLFFDSRILERENFGVTEFGNNRNFRKAELWDVKILDFLKNSCILKC